MDLPSSGRPVALVLWVRHFRCANAVCPRKTFAESLPNLLLPHAQRTTRLRESLQALGEDVGGEAGARASKRQGMACSADTILRLLRQATLPATPPVKVLGVDEWGATRSCICSRKNSRKEALTWGSAPSALPG